RGPEIQPRIAELARHGCKSLQSCLRQKPLVVEEFSAFVNCQRHLLPGMHVGLEFFPAGTHVAYSQQQRFAQERWRLALQDCAACFSVYSYSLPVRLSVPPGDSDNSTGDETVQVGIRNCRLIDIGLGCHRTYRVAAGNSGGSRANYAPDL